MTTGNKSNGLDLAHQHLIAKAITACEEALQALRAISATVPTNKRSISEIQKYISRSGNETWKCDCLDQQGLIYIRQMQKDSWSPEHWKILNDLYLDRTYGCDIQVETIIDGDFQRIVKVNHFEVFSLD